MNTHEMLSNTLSYIHPTSVSYECDITSKLLGSAAESSSSTSRPGNQD